MDGALPRRRLPLGKLAVAAALVVAVSALRWWTRAPSPTPGPTPLPPVAAMSPARSEDGSRAAAVPRAEQAPSPRLPPLAKARARLAIDRYVDEAGLAGSVGEVERARLVTTLAQVRTSSRWLQRHGRAPRAREREHRQALIEADRVFRDTLGVGLSDFIAALSPPGTIEDLGATRQ